jgi:hypothetical protein
MIGGFAFTVFYAAWALLIYLMEGPARFDRLGMSFVQVIGCYLVMGVTGGVVVGLGLGVARYLLGALVLGFLGAFPVILTGLVTVSSRPLAQLVQDAALLSLVFGPASAFSAWYQWRRATAGNRSPT